MNDIDFINLIKEHIKVNKQREEKLIQTIRDSTDEEDIDTFRDLINMHSVKQIAYHELLREFETRLDKYRSKQG